MWIVSSHEVYKRTDTVREFRPSSGANKRAELSEEWIVEDENGLFLQVIKTNGTAPRHYHVLLDCVRACIV